MNEEQRLPKSILDKAILFSKEYGWRHSDFKEVVEAARQTKLGNVGGQVMFLLPDGTCELYWLAYDTIDRKKGEDWITYCNRTANECLDKFNALPTVQEIVQEGISTFEFLKDKVEKEKIDIENYLVFILYFNDKETDNAT